MKRAAALLLLCASFFSSAPASANLLYATGSTAAKATSLESRYDSLCESPRKHSSASNWTVKSVADPCELTASLLDMRATVAKLNALAQALPGNLKRPCYTIRRGRRAR